MTTDNYYSDEMNARRKKFNNIINGIDMVLMNNIPEVDESIWDNFGDKSPLSGGCDIEQWDNAEASEGQLFCSTHECETDDEYECEDGGDDEVYQWFAIGDNDADYLKRHNQYVTYSDMLDTYFLAITHFGTSWDYVDGMVNDILGDKFGNGG